MYMYILIECRFSSDIVVCRKYSSAYPQSVWLIFPCYTSKFYKIALNVLRFGVRVCEVRAFFLMKWG